MDKRFPAGARFLAPRHPEVDRKTDRATALMTRHRIMGERRGVIAMMVMAIHRVEQTPDMLTQGVIQDQCRVSLRTPYRLRLLEQRREPPVIDLLLEPRRCREKTGQGGFVGTLSDTASSLGEACVVQDNQACQILLEMAQLAPMLTEIAKDVRMGGHDGSGSYDGKLHEPFALSSRGWGRA